MLDERCAGFFALGMAKASGRPVVVACTSGTAAANLHPAVVEAWEARVPLIVLTADRPPELREVGAGQAIDQLRLYGSAVKWFVEVGTHEPSRETAIHHRALACRAYWTAAGDRPGPVHLNFPLREPLAPEPAAPPLDARRLGGPAGRAALDRAARALGRASRRRRAGAGRADRRHAARRDRVRSHRRADRRSRGPARRRVRVAAAGRADLGRALRAPRPLARRRALRRPAGGRAVRPRPRAGPGAARRGHAHVEAAARLGGHGAPGGARPARRLARADAPRRAAAARRCRARSRRRWRPPSRCARPSAIPTGWPSWRAADAEVPAALAEAPDPFEPKVLAALERELPEPALVWLSSSMPVRDVEAFFPQSPKRLRFLANRGANGIDGVVSSAAGAGLAAGVPAWLLTGELALLHDLGGLLAARRARADLQVVCLNNGGGAIFDFLPVAEHADAALYEEHIATPVAADLATIAPEVREVRTDRHANVRLHRELVERVAARLSATA